MPQPVPWWPPAPGWYVTGGIIFLLLTWISWRIYTRWRSNAYRRISIKELGSIRNNIHSDQLEASLRALSKLVKRTALTVWHREQVASLTGSEWLRFLDKTGNTDVFTKGDGHLLAEVGYVKKQKLANLSNKQITSLLNITEKWIVEHRVQ